MSDALDTAKITAIIPSAGVGKRYAHSKNKIFVELDGKPIILHTVETFVRHPLIDIVVLAVKSEDLSEIQALLNTQAFDKPVITVTGGTERQDSVYNALKKAKELNTDIVLIHDAVRPLISKQIITNNIEILKSNNTIDGVITAVPVKDTIKEASEHTVIQTLNRDRLWAVQTPQSFYLNKIFSAYEQAYKEGFYGTDDASLIEHFGGKVVITLGSYKNIKITTPEDIVIASGLRRLGV